MILTYSELPSVFNTMYDDPIKVFKIIALKKEIIDTLEQKINNLNCALDYLREVHTSLVECVNCPVLKTEIGTLKVHLSHPTTLSNTCSSSSSERGRVFRKTLMSLGEIERVFHIKLFVIIVEIRVTLDMFVMLGKFKVPMVK